MESLQCENCGRKIGNLETPHIAGGHIICADCAPRVAPVAQINYSFPQKQLSPVTIELTAKKWKSIKLVGSLVFIAGGFAAMFGSINNAMPITIFGAVISLAGLGWGAYGWIGGWWHHG